jgi:hypothetical protein
MNTDPTGGVASSVYGTKFSDADRAFFKQAENVGKDLSMTNGEISKLFEAAVGSGGSEGQLQILMQFLQQRSNKASTISNLIKTLGDSMRSIVQNLR